MSFLDYSGEYEINENVYTFNFTNNFTLLSQPYFIVPPIYDIPFKKVFFNAQKGLYILMDFLNSILFPYSNSIKELRFIQKEILSNSHINYNKGTRIVDNACIAVIEIIENGKQKEKTIIIDIEMENRKIGNIVTKQCFDYGTCLRNENDFIETWVIALCIEESNYPVPNKNAESSVIKKLDKDKSYHKMDFMKIFEIYLNDIYYNLNQVKSIINGEYLEDKGREWLKLFCLTLWCKSVGDNINFCIPHDTKFVGEEIIKAVKILGDIQNIEKNRIKIKEISDKEKEKEKYQEGYNEGEKKGYSKGKKKRL